MWFYVKLAWRNIFRNKRRTIIAGTAIGIMLACLIFYDALLIGMNENMIKSATGSFLGEAQIHAAGFRDTQEVERTIHNSKQVLEELKSESIVKHFTPRALGLAMVTSPANVSSVLLAGIDPETEKALSKVDDAIREGDFFSGASKREIVIGSKLAEILEVGVGDRIVITSAQAKTGDLSQEMFRVSGIYHFNIKEMDAGMAFVRLPKAQKLLGIGDNIHQIAIAFTKTEIASQADLPFWEKYSRDDNEAASWLTILPQFKAILEMTGMFRGVLALILMAVVVFGIINTLFMSLYERMFEFAVLRAVGTRPFGVGKLMLFEAGALGILSGIIGVIMGFILTWFVAKTGIDYRGIEFAGATFQDLLYPVMNIWQFIVYPAGVFIFTFLVGLYPAAVASRMSIAESLRKSL
jgi:ABC-type lipoprotein release transport system permease subunit